MRHVAALRSAGAAVPPPARPSAQRSLGKRIPTPGHRFHSRFPKVKSRKGPAGWQTLTRNRLQRVRASLGSLQPKTPDPIRRGKPRGQGCSRGTSCRLQGSTGEGARSGGLSSRSAFIKKFPVHDPSASSLLGVSLLNPCSGFKLLFPSRRPSSSLFRSDWLGNSPRRAPPRRNPLPAFIRRRGGAAEPTTSEPRSPRL